MILNCSPQCCHLLNTMAFRGQFGSVDFSIREINCTVVLLDFAISSSLTN